jgi:hypothetical protein
MIGVRGSLRIDEIHTSAVQASAMAKRPKTVMLTLRVPISLRAKLRDAAKGDHRSVNGLVVALLWKSLHEEPAQTGGESS